MNDATDIHDTKNWPLIEKHIGNIIDGTGKNLSIWDSDQIGGTRAFALFLSTYSEIIQKGFSTPYASWDQTNGNKINIVYLFDDENDTVAGGIAFEYRPVHREGWIILSFTNPLYRGRRINQILHQCFEENIRARGGNKIGSHIHINNESRLRSALRAGMKPEYYKMSKWIT